MALLLCGKPGYYDYQDEAWPYGCSWGENKRKIRDYLKKKWAKENADYIKIVPTNIETVKAERDQILQWWWKLLKQDDSPVDMRNERFKNYLKEQYDDSIKFGEEIDEVCGPRQKKKYKATDTRNYK